MGADALRHLAPDGKYRVKGGKRVLEYHGQAVSPDSVQLPLCHGEQIPSLEQDLAVSHLPPLAALWFSGKDGVCRWEYADCGNRRRAVVCF